MSQEQPEEYQFRHQTRITLDSYNGIANGVMQLNDPIADGFMRVSDMRRNIMVVNKSESRNYEYSELGLVRVGRVKLVDYASAGSKGVLSIDISKDSWILVVNDRTIWDQLPQSEKGSKKDELFVTQFRDKVREGARECLIREKIFNGGVYSPVVLMDYLGSLFTYSSVAMGETASFITGQHTMETDIKALGFVATGHLVINMISWTMAKFGNYMSQFESGLGDSDLQPAFGVSRVRPDYQEPFVRHHIAEFIAPPVPVDRLVRGLVYDRLHGKDLITASK